MSYTSYFYLLFFLGALVILYYLMPLKWRWLVLLGGSYFFYWLASGKLIWHCGNLVLQPQCPDDRIHILLINPATIQLNGQHNILIYI